MTAVERPLGSRSRSGNASGRAREAVLDGALLSIAERGTTRTTMSGIAVSARVAKATVYNHFRSKEEVFAALLDRELDRMLAVAIEAPELDTALFAAASHVVEHPARAGLEVHDQAVLARLVARGPGDARSRSLTSDGLRRFGVDDDAGTVDGVLRLLGSFLLAMDDESGRRAVTEAVARWLTSPVPSREPVVAGPS